MFRIYGPLNAHELMPTKSPIKPLGVDKLDPGQAVQPAQENDHHHASQDSTRPEQAPRAYLEVEELPDDVPVVTARQIMSSPLLTASPESSIAEALQQFRTHGFRHLPVALASGRLVGIVSERDILRDLARAATGGEAPNLTPDGTPVEQLMTPGVLTATVDTDVRYIARVFVEQRIGALPIVDAAGGAQGIICRSDVLRAVMQHYALELWA